MLIHLGFQGYRSVALQDLKNARTLSRALERTTYYEVLSDIHRYDKAIGGLLGDAKEAIGINQEDVEVRRVSYSVWCRAHISIELRPGTSGRRIQVL